MQLTKIIFLIFIICNGSILAFAKNCRKDCTKKERIQLCIVDKSLDISMNNPFSIIEGMSVTSSCEWDSNVHFAGSPGGIKLILASYLDKCVEIEELIIVGHARPGNHGIGLGVEFQSGPSPFKEYSCLAAENIDIEIDGCNVGEGCAGKLLLSQVANDFASRGGVVRAPTFYSSTLLPGVIPHFSLNGRNQKLIYTPSAKPPYQWEVTGLSFRETSGLVDTCKKDIKEIVLEDYPKSMADQSDVCVQKFSSGRFGQDYLRLTEVYKQMDTSNLTDEELLRKFSNLAVDLYNITYIDNWLETCQQIEANLMSKKTGEAKAISDK